jgi:hypothetical protein
MSTSGCAADCGTDSGTVTAAGVIRDGANTELATVRASATESPSVPEYWGFAVFILGPPGSSGGPLKAHLTDGRLVGPTGEVLYQIPTSSSELTSEEITRLQLRLPDAASGEKVASALATGETKVVLDTDLSGRERVEAVLRDVHHVPASPRRCNRRFIPSAPAAPPPRTGLPPAPV